MASIVRSGGAQNTGIINPSRKATVESDTNAVPKCSFKICSNDDIAKKLMEHTS